jgi:hypothetical protein
VDQLLIEFEWNLWGSNADSKFVCCVLMLNTYLT